MSNDISLLEDMREEFRKNNPHLINLPPARRQTPEEIAAYKEMKRLRLIDIKQQLAEIEAKKNPKPVNSALQKYRKQEKK
ncbi:MAG: hypothetical protein IPM69_10505 [Ignavibacteria bacterium]|nr:hypothetical protein [Ignavibacteria bacterium]